MSAEDFLRQHGITDILQVKSLSTILREFAKTKNDSLIQDLDAAVRIIQNKVNTLTEEEITVFNRICTSYFPNGQYCGGP